MALRTPQVVRSAFFAVFFLAVLEIMLNFTGMKLNERP